MPRNQERDTYRKILLTICWLAPLRVGRRWLSGGCSSGRGSNNTTQHHTHRPYPQTTYHLGGLFSSLLVVSWVMTSWLCCVVLLLLVFSWVMPWLCCVVLLGLGRGATTQRNTTHTDHILTITFVFLFFLWCCWCPLSFCCFLFSHSLCVGKKPIVPIAAPSGHPKVGETWESVKVGPPPPAFVVPRSTSRRPGM